jgi:protein transport protein SEC24
MWLLLPAQVDSDKGFAVQLTVEEGLVTEPAACLQCGLVYTASDGERRIR